MITFLLQTARSSDTDSAIPVRYEMKGFNTLLGSHYDHYYLDYEEYSDDAPNPSVFNLEKSKPPIPLKNS